MPAAVQSLFIQKPDAFSRFLGISAAVHGGAISLLLGAAAIFGGPSIDLTVPVVKATLIRRGVKRDEKLLPRKDEVPPPAPQTKSYNTGKKDLLAAMNAASHGEKPSSRNDLLAQVNKTAKPAELEGDPEGDPNGDSATQEGPIYFGQLSARVKQHYNVSATIPDSERLHLKAQVQVRIGPTGNLIKVELWRSSKNDLFDQAVLAAVKEAAPFPVPPEALRGSLQTDGVTLEFKP